MNGKRPSGRRPRRHPAATRLIEDLGRSAEAEGLPRSAGRLFAYLLLAEQPVTFGDLASDLGMSRGGVSMNTRLLESRGILERVIRPGERKVRYRLSDDPFDDVVIGRLARRRRTRAVVMEALSSLPAGRASSRRRLEEMKRYFDILIEHLESVAAEWRAARRAPARAGNRRRKAR